MMDAICVGPLELRENHYLARFIPSNGLVHDRYDGMEDVGKEVRELLPRATYITDAPDRPEGFFYPSPNQLVGWMRQAATGLALSARRLPRSEVHEATKSRIIAARARFLDDINFAMREVFGPGHAIDDISTLVGEACRYRRANDVLQVTHTATARHQPAEPDAAQPPRETKGRREPTIPTAMPRRWFRGPPFLSRLNGR